MYTGTREPRVVSFSAAPLLYATRSYYLVYTDRERVVGVSLRGGARVDIDGQDKRRVSERRMNVLERVRMKLN